VRRFNGINTTLSGTLRLQQGSSSGFCWLQAASAAGSKPHILLPSAGRYSSNYVPTTNGGSGTLSGKFDPAAAEARTVTSEAVNF